jgi:outer membrane receptor protein involved in Fe transport
MTSTSPIRVARTSVLIAAVALAGIPLSPAWAQEPTPPEPTGRITGRIVDARTGAGLSDVGVQVVGAQVGPTSSGTMSGVDGRYALPRVRAGTVTLHIRRLGYQAKTITGVLLPPGGAVEQDVTLEPATVQLSTTVVTAEAERGTVAEALNQQRNAAGIVSAVTAEEIQRSPDSDAAQAAQRVSGVTIQDGRYVSVRGLGERYTTTSLNGARLPSPEPERKVVPLDLFPAGLLQSVTTAKTFTPDKPGDFSGAMVDLRTREFPLGRQVSYSLSAGYNNAATSKSLFLPQRAGLEWLGFGGGDRALPAVVARAGNISGNPTPTEYNQLVNAFRNSWSVRRGSGSPSTSFGISVGAFAVPLGDGETGTVDRFVGSTGRESVLWGGLLNLSTLLGRRTRVSLNNTLTRSADNEGRYEEGVDENLGTPLQISRLRYVERTVWASQLAGEHELRARQRLDWGASAAGVLRVEPDRSEIVYARDEFGPRPFWYNASEAAVRTFGDLREYAFGGNADYTLRFGGFAREHVLKLGGLARYTTRDADVNSYSITANGLTREQRELAPEEIFDGRYTGVGSDYFRVSQLAQGGSYVADDVVGAGYGMLEYQLADALRIVGGARVESQLLDVTARETFERRIQVRRRYTDVLPSLALNFRFSNDHVLRLSASQTLSRPEYREIVPINQRDVLGGEQFRGNPNLRRTLIQNADVRWEWYRRPREVVSVAVFAKHFDRPIERVYRGTSGTRITTFENARSALNYGVELEARAGLGFLTRRLDDFAAFSNVTLMRSEIDLQDVGAGSTEPERAMVGQAPYVVNAGLTYTSSSGRVGATALYNVVGRRIFAASLLPLPSVYEQERHVVDLSFRFPLVRSISGKVDLKNLLDAPYEVTQGSVTREYYRAGRSLSVGVSVRR